MPAALLAGRGLLRSLPPGRIAGRRARGVAGVAVRLFGELPDLRLQSRHRRVEFREDGEQRPLLLHDGAQLPHHLLERGHVVREVIARLGCRRFVVHMGMESHPLPFESPW